MQNRIQNRETMKNWALILFILAGTSLVTVAQDGTKKQPVRAKVTTAKKKSETIAPAKKTDTPPKKTNK